MMNCVRWLGFRLDVESSVVLICVVFVAVALRDTVDVGLLGFTIVYALSLSGLLQWTVRQVIENEIENENDHNHDLILIHSSRNVANIANQRKDF